MHFLGVNTESLSSWEVELRERLLCLMVCKMFYRVLKGIEWCGYKSKAAARYKRHILLRHMFQGIKPLTWFRFRFRRPGTPATGITSYVHFGWAETDGKLIYWLMVLVGITPTEGEQLQEITLWRVGRDKK